MWLSDLSSTDPAVYLTALEEYDSLLKSANSADRDKMPFQRRLSAFAGDPLHGAIFNHIKNTTILHAHFLHFFEDPGNIANYLGLDRKRAKKLKTDMSNIPDTTARVVSVHLHDLGKTGLNPQHGIRGYDIYHVTRMTTLPHFPEHKDKQAYELFLKNCGITSAADLINIDYQVEYSLLFHDRLGTWLTGENGHIPILEIMEEFGKLATAYPALDYEQLIFNLLVLHLADVCASIPSTCGRFAQNFVPHPILADKLVPGDPAAEKFLTDFLGSFKGLQLKEVLPPLLDRKTAYFIDGNTPKERIAHMLLAAPCSKKELDSKGAAPDAVPGMVDLALAKDSPFGVNKVERFFSEYGVWDYSLIPIGNQINVFLSKMPAPAAATAQQLVDNWVANLVTFFIGYAAEAERQGNPYFNLEFNSYAPFCKYVTPMPQY